VLLQAAAAAAVGSVGLGIMPLTSLNPGFAALAGADTVLLQRSLMLWFMHICGFTMA
jgi:hypothetical protein